MAFLTDNRKELVSWSSQPWIALNSFRQKRKVLMVVVVVIIIKVITIIKYSN